MTTFCYCLIAGNDVSLRLIFYFKIPNGDTYITVLLKESTQTALSGSVKVTDFNSKDQHWNFKVKY